MEGERLVIAEATALPREGAVEVGDAAPAGPQRADRAVDCAGEAAPLAQVRPGLLAIARRQAVGVDEPREGVRGRVGAVRHGSLSR